MKNSILVYLLLITTTLTAQRSVHLIDLQENSEFYSYVINAQLLKQLEENYLLTNKSDILVKPRLNYDKLYSLEGVQNIYKGSVSLSIQLSNKTTKKDTTLNYTFPLTAKNKYDVSQVLSELITASNTMAQLKETINSFIETQFDADCSKIIEAYADDYSLEAIQKVSNALQNSSDKDCRLKLLSLKQHLTANFGNEYCAENMSKIKVLAASGIEFQMIKAVNMLSNIPPKCDCSEEAIQVSKEIGSFFKKRSNEQISTKIRIINQNLSSGSND